MQERETQELTHTTASVGEQKVCCQVSLSENPGVGRETNMVVIWGRRLSHLTLAPPPSHHLGEAELKHFIRSKNSEKLRKDCFISTSRTTTSAVVSKIYQVVLKQSVFVV